MTCEVKLLNGNRNNKTGRVVVPNKGTLLDSSFWRNHCQRPQSKLNISLSLEKGYQILIIPLEYVAVNSVQHCSNSSVPFCEAFQTCFAKKQVGLTGQPSPVARQPEFEPSLPQPLNSIWAAEFEDLSNPFLKRNETNYGSLHRTAALHSQFIFGPVYHHFFTNDFMKETHVARLLRSRKENRDELRLHWSSGKSVQCTTLWTLSLPGARHPHGSKLSKWGHTLGSL